jgi:hypothetical protein
MMKISMEYLFLIKGYRGGSTRRENTGASNITEH